MMTNECNCILIKICHRKIAYENSSLTIIVNDTKFNSHSVNYLFYRTKGGNNYYYC